MRNLASFSTSLKFAQLEFEIAARYPNAETNYFCKNDRPMPVPSLVKLYALLRTVGQSCLTSKIAQRIRAKSSITQR